ncbi:MAG: hypothetical protein LC640_09480 [Frankia sp.]|nr:hypothetical protein [Frankia sp.]
MSAVAPEFMPVLSKGKHKSPRDGACVMEYVSILAGEKFSDRPKCTMPALADLAIRTNDGLGDRERHIMVPLIPRLIGTATDDPFVTTAVAVYLLRQVQRRFWRGYVPAAVARDRSRATASGT